MIIDFGNPIKRKREALFYEKIERGENIKLAGIIRYKCDKCGKQKGITYKNLKRSKSIYLDKQICKECKNDEKRKSYFQIFKKDIEAEEYLMISEEEEYKNRETKLELLCPHNHHIFMSKVQGLLGSRCFTCNCGGYGPINGTKRCARCEKGKLLSKFHNNSSRCKECRYLTSQTEKKRELQHKRNKKGRDSEKGKQFEQDRKLSRTISNGIRNSLNCNGTKNGIHGEELVNFTYDELIKHLEDQFEEEMTWENRGEGHIDHKRPISSFNFQSPKDPDFKECGCLENLQPLGAEDNLRKKDKYFTEEI